MACYYKNIPREELFYGKGGQDFFKTLLSLKRTPQHRLFHPHIIYIGIFGRLSRYRADEDLMQDDKVFITEQRGETCASRVIKAFIRLFYMINGHSIEEYKRLTLDLRIDVLHQYLHHVERGLAEKNDCLLSEMKQSLAHKIKKVLKNGNLSFKTSNSCSILLDRIDAFEKNAIRQETQERKELLVGHTHELKRLGGYFKKGFNRFGQVERLDIPDVWPWFHFRSRGFGQMGRETFLFYYSKHPSQARSMCARKRTPFK